MCLLLGVLAVIAVDVRYFGVALKFNPIVAIGR
jgi:hypothetical protein